MLYLPGADPRVHGIRQSGERVLVLIDRGGSSFSTKVQRTLEALGPRCVGIVVANNNLGPELFAMGGKGVALEVPAVLISRESGEYLRSLLADEAQVVLTIRESEHCTLKAGSKAGNFYLSETMPIEFVRRKRNWPWHCRRQNRRAEARESVRTAARV